MSSDARRAHAARFRVMLVGLGSTTRTALEGLVGSFDMVGLIRDADDDTTAYAQQIGVPVRLDPTIAGVRQAVDELVPDAVVVSSFNRIIGADLLDCCPFVNVHYAPLPRGRGRATVNWAIINGDDSAWISIHHLVPQLDAGGILHQASVPIGPRSTVTTLYEELNALQRDAIADAVGRAIAGDSGIPQDESQATYYCTRTPDDGEIDWTRSAAEIDRLVRALQPPFPPAFTWLGLRKLSIESASLPEQHRRYEGVVPGRVVRIDRTTGAVEVLTGDGCLAVDRVRVAGAGAAPAASVVRSVATTFGLLTSALVDRATSGVDPVSAGPGEQPT
jgi:methionyl-tRNA formyltransferase